MNIAHNSNSILKRNGYELHSAWGEKLGVGTTDVEMLDVVKKIKCACNSL